MRFVILIMVNVLLSFTVAAQNFDQYLKDRQGIYDKSAKDISDNKARLVENWEKYSAVVADDYKRYVENEQSEYEAYRQRIAVCWGKENFATDEAKRIVEYSDDMQSRTDVDLKTGIVKVEILSTLEESLDKISRKLKGAVKEFVELKLDADLPPLFKDQIDKEDYGLSEDASVDELIDEILETVPEEKEIVNTDEGKKQIVRLTVKLADDHIPVRGRQFMKIIRDNSIRFSLDEPLIYAVIEQESAFNPRARSSAPAYGLMQLVPLYGGREAFRHVHGKDMIPLPFYLYVPENNVELGSGYLHKLMNVTFADVHSDDSRMLCAIAAYNTGPNNVCKAMIGSSSMSKAVAKINSMTYEQLFEYLRIHLPYAETRNYIQGVTAKRMKYMEIE